MNGIFSSCNCIRAQSCPKWLQHRSLLVECLLRAGGVELAVDILTCDVATKDDP